MLVDRKSPPVHSIADCGLWSSRMLQARVAEADTATGHCGFTNGFLTKSCRYKVVQAVASSMVACILGYSHCPNVLVLSFECI